MDDDVTPLPPEHLPPESSPAEHNADATRQLSRG
jgi:hypothetical protein